MSFLIPFSWDACRERPRIATKTGRQLVVQNFVLSVVKNMGKASLRDIRDELPDDVSWLEAMFAIDHLKRDGAIVQRSRGIYIA